MTLPSTARERSGKARPGTAEEVVPVSLFLGDEWHEVEVDVDGLTFREMDDVRAALAELARPAERHHLLLCAWVMLRRRLPDLLASDLLDLPMRNVEIGDLRPPAESNSPEA